MKRILFFIALIPLLNSCGKKQKGIVLKSDDLEIENSRIQINLLINNEKQKEQWSLEYDEAEPIEELIETPIGKAVEYKNEFNHPAGYKLTIYKKVLKDKKSTSIRCEFTNNSGQDVRLENFVLINGMLKYKGNPEDWMVSSLMPGLWDSGTLKEKINSTTTFNDDLTLYSKGGMSGVMIAPVRGESDLPCTVQIDSLGQVNLRVESNMSNIILSDGETRSSEEMLISFEKWQVAGTDRAKWVAKTHGARPNRESLFGWCSWYGCGIHVTGEDITNVVNFTKEHKNQLSFNMLLVDEGYQIGRHNWDANEKFPQGMAHYADQIKNAGLMAGIWMSPIKPSSKRMVDGKVVDLSPYEGEVIRVFDESWYEGYISGRPEKEMLDPTNPEVQQYIRQIIGKKRAEGYNLFKLDFTIVRDSKNRYNNKLTRFQVQRELFKLYRECVGEDSYLLICDVEEANRTATGIADGKRIGPDTLPSRGFDGRLNPKNPSNSMLSGIKRMVSTTTDNGTLLCGDPDVTYVGASGPVTEKQMQSFQTFAGLYGGAAYFGGKLWSMNWTDEKMRWLGMVYPNAPEKAAPFAGGFDVLGEQYGMEVSRSWDAWVTVFIWHGNEYINEPRQMGIQNVPTALIGQKFHAYDFWQNKYRGIIDMAYTHECNKFEGQLLRLTKIQDKPQLIGSNLHISMGAAEILKIEENTTYIDIELQAKAGARDGSLLFYSTVPLTLDISTNCNAQLTTPDVNIYSIKVEERSSIENQKIRLMINS